MRLLSGRSSLLWICAGDFNEVLDAGGTPRSERQMDGFREAVQIYGFSDLGFSSLPYTWDNRQDAPHNIKVRLDRGLANGGFLELFPQTTVWHIQTTESDHCCLLIECYQQGGVHQKGGKNFRYENIWRDESYFELVRSAWGTDISTDLGQLNNRLSQVKYSLQAWERNMFGSVRKELAKLRKELERVRAQSIGSGPSR